MELVGTMAASPMKVRSAKAMSNDTPMRFTQVSAPVRLGSGAGGGVSLRAYTSAATPRMGIKVMDVVAKI
jgi:hypothetical protein